MQPIYLGRRSSLYGLRWPLKGDFLKEFLSRAICYLSPAYATQRFMLGNKPQYQNILRLKRNGQHSRIRKKKRQICVSYRKNEVGRLGLPPLQCPTIIIMKIFISHVPLRPSLTCLAATLPWSRQNSYAFKFSYRVAARGSCQKEANQMEEVIVDADKLRAEFLRVLRSRRSGEVPLNVKHTEPVLNPLIQEANPPTFSKAMASCPKATSSNLKDLLHEENLHLTTEEGEQGQLPILIISMNESRQQKRPAIVFLHSTNKCKEWLRPLLEAYASRGYVAIAIDSRYHGERAKNKTTYRDALISSWKRGDTMPFIFDTVWDLIKLADYLTKREDIDPCRIGITGESLGGMHAWFGAAADTRYSVVAPIIGVQCFRWAINNDKWQARVESIKPVFEEAQIELGMNGINKEVVKKVWNRIAPGLDSQFDSIYSVPAIAPRPLLLLNGAEDPRCPIAGLDAAVSRTQTAYQKSGCPENFKFVAQPGIGHEMTPEMVKEASDWFDRFLWQSIKE